MVWHRNSVAAAFAIGFLFILALLASLNQFGVKEGHSAAAKCFAYPDNKYPIGATEDRHSLPDESNASACAPWPVQDGTRKGDLALADAIPASGKLNLDAVPRTRLRRLTFRGDMLGTQSYRDWRELAAQAFGRSTWPSEESQPKPGFKFRFLDYPVLTDFSAREFSRPETWDAGMPPAGASLSNAVWWAIGDHKVGVQRFYAAAHEDEFISVAIFVGDSSRDAQNHLIDCVTAPVSGSGNLLFRQFRRDEIRVGEVSLTIGIVGGEQSPRIIHFARSNICVSLELCPPKNGLTTVNLAALASDIDAAILKLPDVSPEELEALRPVFTKCELARNPIIAGGAWDSKEGVTSATLKVTDPRGDRIFRADAVGQRGYLGGGTPLGSDPDVLSVVAFPDCPAGEHSLWFTAINEHLLFSVYECKVKVERKE